MSKKKRRVLRNNIQVMHDILKLLESGKSTKSHIFYKLNVTYKSSTRFFEKLNSIGLIEFRNANEDELCIDGRSKWYIEITDKGRMFLWEIDKLDRKYDGILLGEKK